MPGAGALEQRVVPASADEVKAIVVLEGLFIRGAVERAEHDDWKVLVIHSQYGVLDLMPCRVGDDFGFPGATVGVVLNGDQGLDRWVHLLLEKVER